MLDHGSFVLRLLMKILSRCFYGKQASVLRKLLVHWLYQQQFTIFGLPDCNARA